MKRREKGFKLVRISLLVLVFVFAVSTVTLAADPPTEDELAALAATSDAGVVPELISGNPLSGPGAGEHKVEDPSGGDTGTKEIPDGIEFGDLGSDYPDVLEYPKIEVKYTISSDGEYLSWSSVDQVSEVIVKGGPNAYSYYYWDGTTYLALWDDINKWWYDGGLRAPHLSVTVDSVTGVKEYNYPEISNFGFFGIGYDGDTDPGGGNGNGNGTTPGNGNGNGTNGTNGNGTVISTGTPQAQSLTIAPERPLTALPATGGSIFPMLALSLLLAGSGAVAIRKFKER